MQLSLCPYVQWLSFMQVPFALFIVGFHDKQQWDKRKMLSHANLPILHTYVYTVMSFDLYSYDRPECCCNLRHGCLLILLLCPLPVFRVIGPSMP